MTTFKLIENILNSRLGFDQDAEYRDLNCFLNHYNDVVNNLEDEQHVALINNSLKEYNGKLFKLIEPHFNFDKYNKLKLELENYCNQLNFDCNLILSNETLKIKLGAESNLLYDLEVNLRPEHLNSPKGNTEFEFQQVFFDFIKLRFIKKLSVKGDKNSHTHDSHIKSEDVKPKNKNNTSNKFEGYFNEAINKSQIKELAELLIKENSPKQFTQVTCILTQMELIKIQQGGRKKFFRALYEHLKIPYRNNFSFKGIYDHFTDDRDTVFFCEENLQFLDFKIQIETIFTMDKSSTV